MMDDTMDSGTKLIVAFVLVERPDYELLDAESAVMDTLRHFGRTGKQVTVEDAKEFFVLLKQRIALPDRCTACGRTQPEHSPGCSFQPAPEAIPFEPSPTVDYGTIDPTVIVSGPDIAAWRDALEFYADPETYHALVILGDPPCGEFADDFDDSGHPDYGRNMPGKRARAALGITYEGVAPHECGPECRP